MEIQSGTNMLKFFCANSEIDSLFEKYWKVSDFKKFVYTEKEVLLEYDLKSSIKLLNLIKENGYAYIEQPNYCCIKCNEPRRFYSRNDFKSFVSRLTYTCIKCKEKEILFELTKFEKIDLHFNKKFNRLLDENIYSKNKVLANDIVKDLSFLELVYLYIIIDKLEIKIDGKISAVKCASFLHEEFYKKNSILKKLVQKDLIFFNANFFIVDYLVDLHNKGVIEDDYFFKDYNILNETIKNSNLKTYSILLKPYRTSFLKYKQIISSRIINYKLSVSDIEELAGFLEQKRNQEILFLIDVVEYNNEIKLLTDNGILWKINEITNKENLKKIYGYLNHSVNSTLFQLDLIDDNKRFLLKNRIFSNIFKSKKEYNIYEKSLPKNYRKSNFIKFLEENYELDCTWEEVPVDIFIKNFIKKLNSIGKLK